MKLFSSLFLALFLSFLFLAPAQAYRASQLTHTTLYPVTAVTADTLSSAVDISNYDGPICVIINVAAAGSGNTIDIKLQNSATSGGSYTDVTGMTFTQVGNAASQQMKCVNKDPILKFVKLNMDITTGSSISAAVAASIVGYKKYQP
jgi:hypothetical protein